MLEEMERDNPGLRTSALSALMNVRPSHLLDAGLWEKLGLEVAAEAPTSDVLTTIGRRLASSG
jgi:tRNA 2-thiocytidine biosynthesis protein TtcA